MSLQEENKNIVLVGMMGAGKSYIGGKLAKLLVHFDYVDIDAQIEQEENMSIPEIFEKKSEAYFRNLENQMIEKFADKKNYIIATGGGAFENPENIKALAKNGISFYLKTSPKEIVKRVKYGTGRPLLKDDFSQEKVKNLLKKREKNYLKANFVIDTDEKRAYTILDEILNEYENYVR